MADADPSFSGGGDPLRVSPTGQTTLLGAVTGRDNVTLDIIRILLALTGPVFVLLEIYAVVWLHQQVNFNGMAALIIAGGGALDLKGHTEPDGRPYADVAPQQFVDQGPR